MQLMSIIFSIANVNTLHKHWTALIGQLLPLCPAVVILAYVSSLKSPPWVGSHLRRAQAQNRDTYLPAGLAHLVLMMVKLISKSGHASFNN